MEAKVALTEGQIEEIIKSSIHAAMVSAIGANGSAFIEAFVKECLEAKRGGAYSGDPPMFQAALRRMMEETVQQFIKEWIESKREEIRDKTIAKCKESGDKLIADFVSRAIDVIPRSSISLIVRSDEVR